MSQKMCRSNVFKCPKTPFGCCELVGSFQNEEEAKKCEKKANNEINHETAIILISKLEYEA